MKMFGKSAGRENDTREAAERLAALPARELAAELLPAFGAGQKRPAHGTLMAANWLMSGYPGGAGYVKQLLDPVREAVAVLEHAGLLLERRQDTGGSTVSITRLGEQALSAGTVQEYLDGRPGSPQG
jgi:hypothetical protein